MTPGTSGELGICSLPLPVTPINYISVLDTYSMP